MSYIIIAGISFAFGVIVMAWFYSDTIDEVEKLNYEIKTLESEKKCEIGELNKKLDLAYDDISKLTAISDETPSDCKKGPWCRSCDFVKTYQARNGHFSLVTKYYCGKADSCKNFVQKEN